MSLNDRHLERLAASGIDPQFAALRGYETVENVTCLQALGLAKKAQTLVPGLMFPLLHADGSNAGWMYKPDNPRLRDGKPCKYEIPYRQRNVVDVPPGVGGWLLDPAADLWVTEGTKKADCGAARGLCIVAINGVYGWMREGVALPDWLDIMLTGRRVILAFDSDVCRNPKVLKALHDFAAWLTYKGAHVDYLHLPDDPAAKVGLDDYLVSGHTTKDLYALVTSEPPGVTASPAPAPEPKPVQPISLDEAHEVFRKWLGEDYDTDALDVTLAAAAVERFDDGSDPVWLLIISGPGAAKTETVQACAGVGAKITSTITGEAALLSATPKRDRRTDATGGLLRKIGDRGLLVIKDVTSILSMNKDVRGKVLAAMREIFDGHWYREVGAEGGHTLEWKGRLVVVGAVTTAWDTAHGVIATLGDRFVLVRIDSTTARQKSGRKAIGNTGAEATMRAELAAAVGGVIAGMATTPITITDNETEALLQAADLVTLARTGVEYDYKGNVVDAHAPEMPTRFAKQLAQIVRGGVAIGMDRADALRLAIRCARDSMPPLRLAILRDLAANPDPSSPTDVRRGINKPRATVDRQLQALHILGLADLTEIEVYGKTQWYYTLAADVDPGVLGPSPEKSPHISGHQQKSAGSTTESSRASESPRTGTDFSGNGQAPGHARCQSCGARVLNSSIARCANCQRKESVT
jgi:hypothetical protein